jgi:hypothetical protein
MKLLISLFVFSCIGSGKQFFLYRVITQNDSNDTRNVNGVTADNVFFYPIPVTIGNINNALFGFY